MYLKHILAAGKVWDLGIAWMVEDGAAKEGQESSLKRAKGIP